MEMTIADAQRIIKSLTDFIQGKESVKQMKNYTDIKSVFDALDFADLKIEDVLLFPKPENDRQKWHNNLETLCFVRDIMVGDFEPDYTNSNQYKYLPWMEMKKDGSGFSFWGSVFDRTRTGSSVGSRLCFPTEEMSEYFAQTFEKEINDLLTNIPKKWQLKK